MSWLPKSLREDPEIEAIGLRTVGYICQDLDLKLNALRRRDTPEADLYILALEDMRSALASVRQGMLDMALLASQRAGLPAALNPDATDQKTLDRRNKAEKIRRDRLALYPPDHPCAPINWKKDEG